MDEITNLSLELLHTPDFHAVSNSPQYRSDLQALSMVRSYYADVLVGCNTVEVV